MLILVCLFMAYISYADTIITVRRNGVTTIIRHSQNIDCGSVEPGAGVTIVDCKIVQRTAVVPNTIQASLVKNEMVIKEGQKSTVLLKIRDAKATNAN